MIERRPRTPDEILAIDQMRCVGYPVGSWDKRFMRHLREGEGITGKEAPQLWRLFIKYRRQTDFPEKQRLLDLARTLSAPDLRKLAKCQREQAEIDALKHQYSNERIL